ncbi:MAG: 30S ribosomal protein S19e [Candidatus Lokiarchaeota archaeon]|nr:30S ribosomal protein S19e [Candidatus Lokiarchaeota archaeon]
MTTIYDVPVQPLIDKAAEELKKYEEIKPPSWADYVKTAVYKERPPEQPAEVWWYKRCASLLRKIYMKGPIGINRLRRLYGGKQNRGSKPNHFKRGGSSIIRNALRQLEQCELLEIRNKRGRVLTNKGFSFLDRIAHQIKLQLQEEIIELKKY